MARMPRGLLWITGIMLVAVFLAAVLGGEPLEPLPAPIGWGASRKTSRETDGKPAGEDPGVASLAAPRAGRTPAPLVRGRPSAPPSRGGPIGEGPTPERGRLEVLARERGRASGLAGATVRLIRHTRVIQETQTTTDGRARLSLREAGVWIVEASSPRHPPVRCSRTLSPDEAASIELILERGQTVQARVEDAPSGSPVSGAEIRFWHPRTGLVRKARTDATGCGRLEGLPRADWVEARIHASRRGFHLLRSPSGRGFERLTPDSIRIRMQRSARLTGHVRRADGVPVPGALVCLDLDETPFRVIAPLAPDTQVQGVPVAEGLWARTDAGGGFTFSDFPALERTTLAIHAPGRVPETRHLVLSPGEDRRDFAIRLRAGAELAGRVTDPNGEPAPGAEVLVARRSRLRATVRTDTNGEFVVAGLAPGPYGVKARGGAWIESPVKALRLARGGRTPGLELVLRAPAPPLVGRVVDERGRPRPGVEVVARGVRRPGLFLEETFWPVRTETDGGGRFRLVRLRPDWAYTVEVSVPGGRMPITRGPLQRPWTEITIVAATPGGIEGALGAGLAPPLTRVTAIAEDDRAQAVSDACTTSPFSLAGLVPGRYRVEAHGGEELIAAADGVVVRPGEVTRGVRLTPVTKPMITGRVIDASGRPLEGVPVAVMERRPSGPPLHHRVRTDREGRFRLTRLRPGVCDLMTGENGLGFAVVRRVGADTRDLVIRFDPSCTLRVEVIDRHTMEPVGGASVGLVTRGLGAARVLTGRDGRAELKITPGAYAVVVVAEGYRSTGNRVSIQSAGRVVSRRFSLVREDP